jgi:hypothetical protein
MRPREGLAQCITNIDGVVERHVGSWLNAQAYVSVSANRENDGYHQTGRCTVTIELNAQTRSLDPHGVAANGLLVLAHHYTPFDLFLRSLQPSATYPLNPAG